MIRAILLCVLLTACASTPKSYGRFSAEEPCVFVGGDVQQFRCTLDSTAEEQLAWYDKHYREPYLDEREAKALALCKPASAADIGTTFVALTACSAVEFNPIFAGMKPSPDRGRQRSGELPALRILRDGGQEVPARGEHSRHGVSIRRRSWLGRTQQRNHPRQMPIRTNR